MPLFVKGEDMFTINGILWRIHFVPPNSRNLMRSDGSMTFGVCDGLTHDIYISNAISDGFLRKVLIHEVCHSAMFSYGIYLDLEQEELFCDLVSTYGDEIISVVDNVFMGLQNVA